MTIIQPTRTVSLGYGFTWNAATSTQSDKLPYTIRLNAAIAPPSGTPVFCDIGGTAFYGDDWRVPGASSNGLNKLLIPWGGAAGATLWNMPIDVNENLDTTETHILTITGDVGATATHTATCNRGLLDKPSRTNKGDQGFATQSHAGGTFNSTQHFTNKLFTGPIVLNSGASGSTFTRCRFATSSNYGVTLSGASNCVFTFCTWGDISITPPHDGIGQSQACITFAGGSNHQFYDCCFWATSGDICKIWEVPQNAVAHTFERCYIGPHGLGANEHGDAFQMTMNNTAYHGIVFYNSFYDWKETDAATWGGSTNAFFQSSDKAGHENIIMRNFEIRSSWLRGGHYTFRVQGQAQGWVVQNCQLGASDDDTSQGLLTGSGAEFMHRAGNKEYNTGAMLTSFNNESSFP